MIASMAALPELDASRCLNQPLDKRGCTRCVDICPAQALVWDEKSPLPRMVRDRCTACDGCVAICPGDAWQDQGVDAEAIVARAATRSAAGARVLRVACSAAQGAGYDVTIPCHGGWDALLFAAIAAEGIATLALYGLAACDRCPRRFGMQLLRQDEAQYAALSRGMEVVVAIDSAPAAPATASNNHDRTLSSRRHFFRRLLPTLAYGAAATVAQLDRPTPTAEPGEEEEQARPLRQRLFLRALERLQPSFTPVPASPLLPLGAVQCDDRCTACAECVTICPTDALGLRRFGARQILELQPDRCIGCNFCVDGCPESAIHPLPAIALPALLTQQARPLQMILGERQQKGENDGGD